MSKRTLRAVLFDVDDTVYSTTEFAHHARANAVQAMVSSGLKVDEEECLAELEEVISEFGSNYSNHFDKLLQRLPPETYADSLPIIIVASGMVAYHQTKFRNFSPYEDAINVLTQLKDRGVPLGIVTAGVGIKQAEKIVRLGLHKIVESRHIFISDNIGISKANPKIYLRACRSLGVTPAEAMYIGDNPPVDVDVPSRVGMITVLSRRSGKYMDTESDVSPDHVVHNFWDALEVIDQHYELKLEG